jgi:hypothetical protein
VERPQAASRSATPGAHLANPLPSRSHRLFGGIGGKGSPANFASLVFFKWIKQHLRIKRFYGTSENAVKTQIWIAVSVYVLVAIIKKRLRLEASLYTLMQVLSVTIFEKMPIQTALSAEMSQCDTGIENNQLNLFGF